MVASTAKLKGELVAAYKKLYHFFKETTAA
jgi:hypothetical protein